MPDGSDQRRIHASCVAVDGRAVLIIGASGSGKSALALQLIALGGELVADDQTELTRQGAKLSARAPDRIAGLIEARGIGLLSLRHQSDVPVSLVVDLDTTETHRLPAIKHHTVMDLALPCLHKVDAPHFPAAIMAYLRGNRKDPDASIGQ